MTSRQLEAQPLDTPGSLETPRPTVSVVVPVAERPWALDRLYREYSPTLEAMEEDFEFLFVVKPWARTMTHALGDLIRSDAPIRVLEIGVHAGESEMLAAAIQESRGSIILTLPAYPRVVPEALPELVRRVRRGADLASAKRRLTRSSWLNRLQNRMFHALLRWSVGGDFEDVASGVRALDRAAIQNVSLHGDSYRFLPLLARNEGLLVQEVAVDPHPLDGKVRVYSPGVYVRRALDLLGLVLLVRFTQKPLRFFGIIGTVFGLAGAIILIVLFVQRVGGQGISDRPLLLLGVLFFALGVQAIAIGLVGEIIVHFGAPGTRRYRVTEEIPTESDG